jgi:hypothetical protein
MHRFGRFLRDCAVNASVAVGILLIVEIGLRLFAPQLPRTEPPGSRAVPDSLLGSRYQPNSQVRHMTPEFSVTFSIDERGLRKRSEPISADSTALRILVLGDSFTFGDGNEEKDTWVRVAERSLRETGAKRGINVEMVNAGVEGFDTRSELYMLKEWEPKVKPSIVLLAFAANDVYTNRPASEPPPKSPAKPDGAFSLHVIALAKRMAIQNDRLYARLFLFSHRRAYYASTPDAQVQKQIDITRDLLAEMAAYCRERSVQLLVVSIPQEYAVISEANGFKFRGVEPNVIDAQLATHAHDEGIVWVEALPRLSAVYRDWHRDLYYRVDGHLTTEGNRVLGDMVAGILAPRIWPSVSPD